jgi:DNA-binding CsgD family transcriptional regulator
VKKNCLKVLRRFIHNELPAEKTRTLNFKITLYCSISRELEILHYVLKGIGTKNIAEILNLKMNTVSTLKTRIYDKTHAGNIKELMELATLYNVNY